MSGQVSRGSAGEYQADERAGVAWQDDGQDQNSREAPCPGVFGSPCLFNLYAEYTM